jgi:hypothetical protein
MVASSTLSDLSRPIVAGDPGGQPAERGAEVIQDQGDRVDGQGNRLTEPQPGRIYRNPYPYIGHPLDTGRGRTAKYLKRLALPSGIEPLSPP